MAYLVSNILKDAMGLVGAIEIDESPEATEFQTALRVANMMLGRWSAQSLLLRSTTSLSFPLVVGTSTYTIGNDASFDVVSDKPISIVSGFLRDTSNRDTPLNVITIEHYNSFQDKAISSGLPNYVAYRPVDAQQVLPYGIIYFYLTPNRQYTFYGEISKYLTRFTDVHEELTFDPMYEEALVYNLAARLFRHFHGPDKVIPQDIVTIASSSLANIKAVNSEIPVAKCDIPTVARKFNIYTGQ